MNQIIDKSSTRTYVVNDSFIVLYIYKYRLVDYDSSKQLTLSFKEYIYIFFFTYSVGGLKLSVFNT